MEFEKYHALGNDYLVLPHDQIEGNLSEEEIRLICHRNLDWALMEFFSVPFPLRRHSLGSAFSIPMEARQKKVVTAFASFLCTFGTPVKSRKSLLPSRLLEVLCALKS